MKKAYRSTCLILVAITVLGALLSCSRARVEKPFLWENANVYFLLTDRFFNGKQENDHAYDRGLHPDGTVDADKTEGPGGFHGGDFAGVTKKINEGYFSELGVDAIWISPPFEQIHGFRSGPGFAFYAYHGYWTLDFTQPDAAFGTKEEFQEMVDAAHAKGIRVVLDVIMNHPGYATPEDADTFGFGEYTEGWDEYKNGPDIELAGDVESSFLVPASSKWDSWWGPDWVRVDEGLAGYDTGGTSDTLSCLSGLPDFKTESQEEVELPVFLVNKWQNEGRLEEEQRELDMFFTETGLPQTVTNYQIKWLTDWVSDYGIDGFRCDTAKHVELEVWQSLSEQAGLSLQEWREKNPSKTLGTLPFWTVGEVWDHGVSKDEYYTDAEFDALINFSFRKNLINMKVLPELYTFMSDTMIKDDFMVLSYISSHDTALFTRSKLREGIAALLLAPGAVQIFYGDETGRQRAWTDCPYMDLTMRSAMNWESVDAELLAFTKILGQFRSRHLSIGAGVHQEIASDPYTFSRSYIKDDITDRIIVVMGEPNQTITIDVGGVFQDKEKLANAYDGSVCVVEDGKVSFSSGSDGIILIEEARI